MKIDSLNTQYEIPGFEVSSNAFDLEEVSGEPDSAPYGMDAGVNFIPAPRGWQDMLGLTALSPTPTSIDPPTRPASGASKTKATSSYRVHKDTSGKDGQSPASSANVQRMLTMLKQTRRSVARIRTRAMEGA